MRGGPTAVFVATLLTAFAASACDTCRPLVRAGIFNEHFWGRLSIAFLPFAVILFVVALVHRMGREEVDA